MTHRLNQNINFWDAIARSDFTSFLRTTRLATNPEGEAKMPCISRWGFAVHNIGQALWQDPEGTTSSHTLPGSQVAMSACCSRAGRQLRTALSFSTFPPSQPQPMGWHPGAAWPQPALMPESCVTLKAGLPPSLPCSQGWRSCLAAWGEPPRPHGALMVVSSEKHAIPLKAVCLLIKMDKLHLSQYVFRPVGF